MSKEIVGFPKTVIGFLLLFGGVLVITTIMAYSRKSGNTGLDMAKIHELRKHSREDVLVQKNSE